MRKLNYIVIMENHYIHSRKYITYFYHHWYFFLFSPCRVGKVILRDICKNKDILFGNHGVSWCQKRESQGTEHWFMWWQTKIYLIHNSEFYGSNLWKSWCQTKCYIKANFSVKLILLWHQNQSFTVPNFEFHVGELRLT